MSLHQPLEHEISLEQPSLTLAPPPVGADVDVDVDESGRPADEWSSNMSVRVKALRARHARLDAEATIGHRRQRAAGKQTARARVMALLDDDSFDEVRALNVGSEPRAPGEPAAGGSGGTGDGVVAGLGRVYGRQVAVCAQDFGVMGGTLGAANATTIHRVQDLAMSLGCPVITLNDSGGARIQEGVAALDGYAGIFRRQVNASGVVPQISVILGPCAGGAAYSPVLADFVFMVRGISEMFVTGPDIIAAVTGVETDRQRLGGADVHGRETGTAHFVCDDEESCLTEVRYLVTLLPSSNREAPPETEPDPKAHSSAPQLRHMVPVQANRPYDMERVVDELLDEETALPVQAQYAPNLLCVLGRLDGRVVGVVANQPQHMGGVLDVRATQKGARFVRFCDAFGIALVTLVDVPGFLPGVDQEHGGILRHGAKLLYAYCEATVPRVQVTLRKSYGGAHIVMDSRGTGNDLAFAWPTNEIAVMGAEAAVDLLHRHELRAAEEPDPLRARLAKEHRRKAIHPFMAAGQGLIDDVIDPADTRRVIARSLRQLASKRSEPISRKHSTLPL